MLQSVPNLQLVVKRKTLKQKNLLLKQQNLKNSRTLFQEIDNFLQHGEEQEQPQSGSNSDNSFENVMEAFSDESTVLVLSNQTKSSSDLNSNFQLQYTQQVFACFDKPLSQTSNKVQSHLSTDCTSEGDALNFSSLNCSFNTYNQYYYEPQCFEQQPILQENFTANEIIPLKIDEDDRTTLMIRNIPSEYTREMLVQELNQKFAASYDFLNLPYDYKMQMNAGYAFINIKDKKGVKEFYNNYNGKHWRENINARPCYLRYARVQGKQRLMNYKRSFKQNLIYQKGNLSQIQQLVHTQRQQCDQIQYQ